MLLERAAMISTRQVIKQQPRPFYSNPNRLNETQLHHVQCPHCGNTGLVDSLQVACPDCERTGLKLSE